MDASTCTRPNNYPPLQRRTSPKIPSIRAAPARRRQVSKNERHVGVGTEGHITFVRLRRPDAEGHLISPLAQLHHPGELRGGPDDGLL